MLAHIKARSLLQAAGAAVYAPGEHIGPCTQPYAVVRASGSDGTRGMRASQMTVFCYVPLGTDAQTQLDALCAKVSSALLPMHGQARPTGRTGADTVETAYRALSRSLEYEVLRRSD